MDYFSNYIATNFTLLAISVIMLFIAFSNYKQHKRMSICMIAITGLVMVLSLDEILQVYTKDTNNIIATTILAFLGYVLRPACLLLFIALSNNIPKGKWKYLFIAPLLLNLLIYCLAFIPGVKEQVFYFHNNDLGGISFDGGLLRFTSHVISALYLGYFLYVSISGLRKKHITNAHILLICASLIIACVVVETFFNDDDQIHILNTAIMVSMMFYYLFLYVERGRYDALTHLFNRATYYHDIIKMDKSMTAIIQLDMDGLKYFNDNYGHEEGDKGLKTIADAISRACDNNMYPYRLSGDEFLIIVNLLPEEIVTSKIEQIKSDLRKTRYSCSIGYAFRKDKNMSIDDLIKQSEQAMYVCKEEFYRNSKFERRRSFID